MMKTVPRLPVLKLVAFCGQDAQYTDNKPNHTNNGDGTVTDNVTGLMWQQAPANKRVGAI